MNKTLSYEQKVQEIRDMNRDTIGHVKGILSALEEKVKRLRIELDREVDVERLDQSLIFQSIGYIKGSQQLIDKYLSSVNFTPKIQ